jgi:hypothetical protein
MGRLIMYELDTLGRVGEESGQNKRSTAVRQVKVPRARLKAGRVLLDLSRSQLEHSSPSRPLGLWAGARTIVGSLFHLCPGAKPNLREEESP